MAELSTVERTLVLMRHAKSDYPDDTPDHDRPLAKRGRRDAPRIGTWLSENGYVPDLVVCSTAERTRQTWDLVAGQLRAVPDVRYEPRVYEASTLGLLMLIRELPEDAGTAMFVGHNPAIGELAAGLSGGHAVSFPTAAVAVVRLAGPWASAAPGEAALVAAITPATLR
jgi:phosphohistidine phosphatase